MFARQQEALGLVFSKRRYVLLALTLSLFLFSLTNVFNNIHLLLIESGNGIAYLTTLMGRLMAASFLFANTAAVLTQGTLSALVGISVAMVFYRASMIHAGSIGSTIGGLFAGLLSTGCASCGLSLLSLLGVAGGLAALPFQGMELWLAGMGLLLYSIYHSSIAITAPTCPV